MFCEKGVLRSFAKFTGKGHVHKYQTHFRGFVQTDPLLRFQQYLSAKKKTLWICICQGNFMLKN